MIPSFKTVLLPIALLTLFVNKSASSNCNGIEKLADASNEFAFKLFKTLPSGENVFFSPTSISLALAMLRQGAGGVTKEEINKAASYDNAGLDDQNIKECIKELLALSAHSPVEYTLNIANSIFSQIGYPVLEKYKESLKEYYEAEQNEVDFDKRNAEAVEEINDWVNNTTREKIQKIVESLDQRTVLVLLNAIYFNGFWEREFSRNETKDEIFYNNGVDAVSVPMMNARQPVFYAEERNLQALKLCYNGGDVSMVILLPRDRDGLNKLEEELTPSKIKSILADMRNTTLPIAIPKFKFEYYKELKENLQNLGMVSAFSDGADLSGIFEKGGLKVSGVYHKAVVEVNEEGTEAAGATGIIFIPVSYPPPGVYARHPFLFFIIDERAGNILFFGRVTKL